MKKISLLAAGAFSASMLSAGFAFADGSLPGALPPDASLPDSDSPPDENLPEDQSRLGTETGDEFAPPIWLLQQLEIGNAKLSQAQAYSIVHGAGIAVYSSGNCTNRSNPACTSLDQINSNTILTSDNQSGIVAFKRFSGCAVTITGGTEVGHASGTYSHYNGYKVDISHTSCVDGYIKSAFTYIGLRGDGAPLYKSSRGNLYANEGSHWDITFF